MSILSSIYRHTLARVIPSSPASQTGDPASATISASKKRKFQEDQNPPPPRPQPSRRRKRESYSSAEEDELEIISKRRRTDDTRYAPIIAGETYGSTEIEGQNLHHGDAPAQRPTMVPPPALSPSKIKSLSKILKEKERENSKRVVGRTSLDSVDGASLISVGMKSTQQARAADHLDDEYSMEKARRHAAATDLPPNSGIWERGEKELFFHLSYRGFEPLFPANWMRDFKTMPLSLYHQPDDEEPPLIQHHKLGEFRAIRELRGLLELGKNVRDQVLSSPMLKREAIIEKAATRYITWAIKDMGIQVLPLSANSRRTRKKDGVLPIHIIIKLKPRQTTTDCLLDMKRKLHDLAARHRRVRNIHASIERDEPCPGTPNSEDETRVLDGEDEDLPVLYGIMICKSVLAIFTMNSRTPPLPTPKRVPAHSRFFRGHDRSPTFSDGTSDDNAVNDSIISAVAEADLSSSNRRSRSLATTNRREDEENDSNSDPRFISDFDFSDAAKDVWNALVIAIIAMQIRKDLVIFQQSMIEARQHADENMVVEKGIEEMDIDELTDDDPDA